MFLFFLICVFHARLSVGQIPVVLWHGMGDCCCNPFSMGAIQNLIEKEISGVYVYSVMIGNNVLEDTISGYLKNVNSQVEEVCEKIKNDKKFSKGFNAIGFSQGGQFLRALVQRCNGPSIFNLISIGGQHQGIYGFPDCPPNSSLCDYVRTLLNFGAYKEVIQDHVVQAEYWHDPLNEDEYKTKSLFLSDINQEMHFNTNYKSNILKLKNFVLVKFNNDSIVVPRETEWFGFYKPGQSNLLYTIEESDLYKQDKLGLKSLNEDGRLKFISLDGDHLQFKSSWFIENIINKYLTGYV